MSYNHIEKKIFSKNYQYLLSGKYMKYTSRTLRIKCRIKNLK